MIDIKQLRENYDIITEKDSSDVNKLTSLIRAGLFDAKKLPVLKRALEKDPTKLTISERKILLDLLDSLMSEVLHSQQVYSKVKQNVRDMSEATTKDYLSKYDDRYEATTSEKELPSVIILKRKAIRIFPGRQKVGLYYSQSLDRYVSIPFGPGVPNMNEEVDLNEISAEYKMKKLGKYASKEADIENDDTKDDVSKSLETTKRQVRAKKFMKKAFKDKTERDAASKFADKSVQNRKDYLKSYDAPRKKGQLSNLTKALTKGEVGGAEYIGAQIGVGLGKLFSRKKKVTPTPSSTSAPATKPTSTPATAKPTQKLTDKQEKIKADANKRIASAKVTGAKSKMANITPKQKLARVNTARKTATYALMDKRKAGIKESFETKFQEKKDLQEVIGAVSTAARIGSAAKKGYDAFKASRAARAAGETASTAGKAKGLRHNARVLSRYVRRKAKGVDLPSNDGNASQSTQNSTPERKFTTPGEFKMQTKISAPKPQSQVQTGFDKRADAKYRKSLEQPLSESINMVAKGNYDSYELHIKENTITINTTIAKKINNLYESLNAENKKVMKKMINEGDAESFKKILQFVVRQ